MNEQELTGLTIAGAARLIKARKLSPVELARASLERIERLQPTLGAFITVTADLAMRQARTAENEIARGDYRGPLHGVPFTLKDLYFTKGIRTTAGSRILADHVPDFDAPTTERLYRAGAVLLGKTNLHEWACGVTTDNPFFGTCHNPWKVGHIPGGSSGGSAAAVAASLGLASLGSDTGGSIRIPAHMTGIVGHKPTYGLVPRTGILPESWSFDHGGPMTRTVEDAAIVLQAIAGHDPRDPSASAMAVPNFRRGLRGGVKGLRVGVPANYYFDGLHPEVAVAVRQAIAGLAELGARLVDVQIPEAAVAMDCCFVIAWAEAAHYHRDWVLNRPQDYGADLRDLLEASMTYLATDLLQAFRVRARIRHAFRQLFETVDVLVSPTGPLPATPHGATAVDVGGRRISVMESAARLTALANVTGEPACSVPCGFTEDGLPVGLMVHGPAFRDALVLRVAHAYERANDWHKRRPIL
jgi:aspartyl-tRNA(Asn)/glutamyl-tRNA(Gln) amidotransferase subunit A